MPVSSTIPVTGDFREVTLALGEGDNITALWLTGNYLFAITDTAPAKLVRLNKDDFSQRTAITFAADGEHDNGADILYASPNQRIYALFQNPNVNTLMLTSVHPDTMVAVDEWREEDFRAGVGSLTTDDVFLYAILFGTYPLTYIARARLDDIQASLTLTALPASFPFGRSIRFTSTPSGNRLFCVGQTDPPDAGLMWVARVDPATMSVDRSTTIPGGATLSLPNNFGVSADHIWVGSRDFTGRIRQINKATLAVTNIQTPITVSTSSSCRAVEDDSPFVWALFDNGKAVRLDSTVVNFDQRLYALQSGFHYRMFSGTTEGNDQYLYTSRYSAPSKIERYRIPRTVVQEGGIPVLAKSFGGNGSDLPYTVTVDSSGNIIVAGSFTGICDFTTNQTGQTGVSKLTSAGDYDIFLAKYTSAGVLSWVKRFGGTGREQVKSIALDSSGNIIICGDFAFGPSIMKFSSSGDLLWSKGPISVFASIAIDSQGNVIGTGSFSGQAVDFGDGFVLSGSFSSIDCCLAKYSPSGTCLWAKKFVNGGDQEFGTGVAVDRRINPSTSQPYDTILMAGWAYADINLGGIQFVGDSWNAFGFIGKFDPVAGAHLWSRSVGLKVSGDNTLAWTRIFNMCIDSGGDIAVSGAWNISSRFDSPLGARVLGTAANREGFVAKYSGTDGHYLWGQAILGDSDCTANGIVADSNNNIILTGSFYRNFNFGGKSLTTGTGAVSNCFVAKYSSLGVLSWAEGFGGTGSDSGLGVAVDSAGRPVVTGYFQGTVTFGTFPLTNAGGTDAFLMTLSS